MEVEPISRAHQERSRRIVLTGIACTILAYGGWMFAGGASAAPPTAHSEIAVPSAEPRGHHAAHNPDVISSEDKIPPAYYSILPFIALLLCIAVLPLSHKTAHWWEKNGNKLIVSAVLAAVILVYYALAYGHGVKNHATHQESAAGWSAALTVLQNAIFLDYIPFITLLFSLYVLSGGISVEGDLIGRPTLNCIFLAIGGIIASLVGTTGAAMMLIRPLLTANKKRTYASHTVIFFIFIVCNTGGCLLPIGDPPLFMGYLAGVPFTWTLGLWPQWLFMNGSLLAIYFVWDTLIYRRENHAVVEAPPEHPTHFAIRGLPNFLWLAGVICATAFLIPTQEFLSTGWIVPMYFREVVMLGLTALSLWSTSPDIRLRNAFNYDAIEEVAILFSAIFICMQSPIQILDVHGAALGINEPWEYYWSAGTLSSFLDNAPTYIVFFETAKSTPVADTLVAGVGVRELAAISLGAVFMGAMTYIGNGPNFMVKTIAEKNRVKMPSFFGYMAYSCSVLLPLSLIMTWVFFSADPPAGVAGNQSPTSPPASISR